MNLNALPSLFRTALLATLPVIIFSGNALSDLNLRFGVYTADKPSAVVRQFRPVLAAIEDSLSKQRGKSVKIRMQLAKNYDTGVQDLVDGKVDFPRFGPAS